jgi:hypothetical protein
MAHVLIVQDIFSRFIWTVPMAAVSDTVEAFETVLQQSEDRMVEAVSSVPERLDTDGGPEFASDAFKAFCARKKIEHFMKHRDDRNAIATVDSAIANLKRILKRIIDVDGGSWLSHLEKATLALNQSHNSGIGTEPQNMTDETVFNLQEKAGADLATNTLMLQDRQAKLEKTGAYRTHEPLKGNLRRRIDADVWSKDIREVASFPAPGMVMDADGKKTLLKYAKPVPADSSRTARVTVAPPPPSMRTFAERLKEIIPGRGMGVAHASRLMRTERGFISELKMAKLSFLQFAAKFPDLVTITDGRLFARGQARL